jgi:hypothetical protein
MDALGTLSPYRTEHVNRFGNYVIDSSGVRLETSSGAAAVCSSQLA